MSVFLLVIGFLLGGIVLLWGAGHGLAKLLRRYGPAEDVPISKPVQVYGRLTPAEVEAVRVRAEIRQKRAEARHGEGHAIESGEPDRSIKLISSKR